jgi:hypothetical protein
MLERMIGKDYVLLLADVATGVFVAPRPWPTRAALTGAGFLR